MWPQEKQQEYSKARLAILSIVLLLGLDYVFYFFQRADSAASSHWDALRQIILTVRKKKYYAVAAGRQTGIFTEWGKVLEQVNKFSGAIHQSFDSLVGAEEFLAKHSKETSRPRQPDSLKPMGPAQWVLEVLVAMRRQGVEPDATTYAILHSPCNTDVVQVGMAKKLEEALQKQGVKFELAVYNALIGICVNCTQPNHSQALMYYSKMRSYYKAPDLTTYTLLLRACAESKGKRSAEAQDLYRDMVGQGFKLSSIDAWNDLLRACPQKAVALFAVLQKQGLTPDRFTYSILIDVCEKNNHTEQALKFFEEMQRKGVKKKQRYDKHETMQVITNILNRHPCPGRLYLPESLDPEIRTLDKAGSRLKLLTYIARPFVDTEYRPRQSRFCTWETSVGSSFADRLPKDLRLQIMAGKMREADIANCFISIILSRISTGPPDLGRKYLQAPSAHELLQLLASLLFLDDEAAMRVAKDEIGRRLVSGQKHQIFVQLRKIGVTYHDSLNEVLHWFYEGKREALARLNQEGFIGHDSSDKPEEGRQVQIACEEVERTIMLRLMYHILTHHDPQSMAWIYDCIYVSLEVPEHDIRTYFESVTGKLSMSRIQIRVSLK